jgi:radical SAM superfamily enzyme YgiQ (UPF0313 family)
VPKVVYICPAIGRFKGERRYIRSWQMKPLALGVLSALTPDHWDQALIDDRMEEIDYDQDADLVAISVETYAARRGFQIAEEFRKRGRTIVMGGYHATLCTDETLEHADAVCVGRAEGVWSQLLADAEAGKLQRIYQSPADAPSAWVSPDHSLFEGKGYVKLDMVETSRGCPGRCKFCSITSFYQARFERRDPQSVVDEIQRLGMRTVFFVDDNFAGDRLGAMALLKAITPLKLRWITQISVRAGNDPEMLDAMAASGCIGALIGFESTDAGAITAMNKGVNRKVDYARVVSEFTSRQMGVYGTFLFGYDGDSNARRQREIDFAIDSGLCLAAFNHIVPFPGTTLYSELESAGRLLSDRWWMENEYRFGMLSYQPVGSTPRSVERACVAARKQFYSLTSIRRRSKHVPFFANRVANQGTYWGTNLMLRREQDRFGWPIGEVDRPGDLTRGNRKRFKAEPGELTDELDAELRELMSECSMVGAIEKTYLAEPSLSDALSVIGRNRHIWTLRDRAKLNRLIGMGVLAEKPVWINGRIERAGYLTMLRIDPEYRALGLTALGYSQFRKYVGPDAPGLCLTAIFDDNANALRALTGNRSSVPQYSPLAKVISLVTGRSQARRLGDYPGPLDLQRCTPGELDELLAFWEARGRLTQMTPAYQRSDFTRGGLLDGLSPENIVVARRDGEIVACCGLWDQRRLRQLRVDRYNGLLRRTKPLANAALRMAGLPTLPRAGTVLDMRYAALQAFTDIRAFEAAFKTLLSDMDNPATMVAIIAPSDSAAWEVYNRLRGFRQGSTLYTVALADDPASEISTKNLYIEGGSL